MTLRQQAIRGAAWGALTVIGTQGMGMVTLFVLARLLGPQEMGLVAYASVFTTIMAFVVGFGLAEAVVQREGLEPLHLDTAFWTVTGLGLGSTLLAQALAVAIGALLHKPDLVPLIRVLSVAFVTGALAAIPSALLTRGLRFRTMALLALLGNLVGNIVGIGLAFAGYGAWALVWQRLCGGAAGLVLLWTASRWRPRLRFSRMHLRQLAGFGVSIFTARIAEQLTQRSIDFLIGFFLGDKALGFYTIATRLLQMLRIVLFQAIQGVALPTFSRLQGDLPRVRQSVYLATGVCGVVALPVFLGVTALAPSIVLLTAGEKWMDAAPMIRVLSLLGIVNTINVINTSVMQSLGRPGWALAVRLVNAIASVLGFFLAMRWGLLAVSVAFVARGYLLLPLQLYLMRRLIQLQTIDYLRQFVAPLSASLVMAAVAVLVERASRGALGDHVAPILAVLVAAVAYAALIYLLSPFVRQQVAGLRRGSFLGRIAGRRPG